MFQDKPGIVYENPPPPDGYDCKFILESKLFFSLAKPQSVPDVNFIKIDRSLIHKKLLGGEVDPPSAETIRRHENRSNENIEAIQPIEREDLSTALEEAMNKNKASKENVHYALEKTKLKHAISQRDESIVSMEKNKGRKKNESKEKKKDDTGSGDLKNAPKKRSLITNTLLTKALENISKSYSISKPDSNYIEEHKSKSHKSKSHSKKSSRHKRKDSRNDASYSDSISEADSDDSEKHKTKSSSHKGKSHPPKSPQHRKRDKVSRNDTSYSDVISNEEVGQRKAEVSVKQEILSDGEILSDKEESLGSSFPKKDEITIKKEVSSSKDDVLSIVKDEVLPHKKDKKKRPKKSKKKYDGSRNLDDSKLCDDSRKNYTDYSSADDSGSRHYDDEKSRGRDYDDDSRSRHYDDEKSRGRDYDNDSRSRHYDDEKSRGRDYDDDSRSRRYDDDSSSRHYDDDSRGNYRDLNPYIKREVKQEIKQEPESASLHGPNDFYCKTCKLLLNSETTYNTHIVGKKHKRAERQNAEQEVARSTVLEIKQSQLSKYPRPPEMERIELPYEVSIVQGLCEDDGLLIVGLDFVQEILGYDETKYYCNLCDAQCVPGTIIKHLTGKVHLMSCLERFYPRSYAWVQSLDRKDKRIDREIKCILKDHVKHHGRGKIRVFKDVPRTQRNPESFNPHLPSTSRHEPFNPQPSTSRQGLDVLVKKTDELKITDEEYLSRDYSDFYCKICDSHMNNFSMWESHARGKKHARSKAKAKEGVAPSNNDFIEAPQGTISHLEEIIMTQYPGEIIVGLNFIRESQGDNGDFFNCYLCGSVCTTMDIVPHLFLKKHKAKYLEKMHSDGHHNAINDINALHIGETARENLINDECERLLDLIGPGKPVVSIPKKTY